MAQGEQREGGADG
jgi:hypothetical protein